MTDHRKNGSGPGLRDVLKEPLQDQSEPMKHGDNPMGRLSGTGEAPVGVRKGGNSARAPHPFSDAELSLINAFLAYSGYSEAQPSGDEVDPDRRTILSFPPDDSDPVVVIGKDNGTYSFALVEQDAEEGEKGAVSAGYEGVESLPLLLAMIDDPDRF